MTTPAIHVGRVHIRFLFQSTADFPLAKFFDFRKIFLFLARRFAESGDEFLHIDVLRLPVEVRDFFTRPQRIFRMRMRRVLPSR